RETRMYAMGVCLVLVASWLLARAIKLGYRRYWIEYGVAAAACLYTHYYLAFSVATQALAAVYWSIRMPAPGEERTGWEDRLRSVCSAYAVTGALFAPWVPAFLMQSRRVQQDFWIPPVSVMQL